jgi:AcrR family transcriptional regulator
VTKSDDRRTALIDVLTDHVLAHGLAAASLRPLAKAAKISDRMLLYYFKDKSEIIAAVIERTATRIAVELNNRAGAAPLPLNLLHVELRNIVFADQMWPYMRVWLEIAALAARGDPFYRDIGGRIARGFLAWGSSRLNSATPAQREADAAKLLVSIEGMLVLKSVGMDDVCISAI